MKIKYLKIILVLSTIILTGCIASIPPKSLSKGTTIDTQEKSYVFGSIHKKYWEKEVESIALIIKRIDSDSEIALGSKTDISIVRALEENPSHGATQEFIFPVMPGKYEVIGIARQGFQFLGTVDKIQPVYFDNLKIVTPDIKPGEAVYLGEYTFDLKIYIKKRDFYYEERNVDFLYLSLNSDSNKNLFEKNYPGFENLTIKQIDKEVESDVNKKLPIKFIYECDGNVGCSGLKKIKF